MASGAAGVRPAYLPLRTGRSATNRSLERGLEVLRAFRPGLSALGNAELVERTGLPPATVSRLAQTLVDAGWLHRDPKRRLYRLAAPALSLALAMRQSSRILEVAAPRMHEVARRLRINVGVAVADRDEMVYLESIRHGGRPALRTVVTGQRVPMELTALGQAWLAVAPARQRQALIALFRGRRTAAAWPAIAAAIARSKAEIDAGRCCAAAWQPEVVSVALPLIVPGEVVHVLNMSVSGTQAVDRVRSELGGPLQALRQAIVEQAAALASASA
ncbi:MAG: IclR family transcriptional regulator [Lautropia sp.]